MSLPKIAYTISEIVQKSTGKKFKFRPYLVKEEKLLMMAKQGASEPDGLKNIFIAIEQIVNNCCMDKNLKIEDIPIFDLEYFFLKLRAISVNNKENVTILDDEDKKQYKTLIDFNAIDVKFPEVPPEKNIKLPGDIIITLKYPSARIYQDNNLISKIIKNDLFDFVIECIDKVYKKDTIIPFERAEMVEFLDDLDHHTYEKLKDWIRGFPRIDYTLTYKNSLGNERKEEFRSLMDFFFCL